MNEIQRLRDWVTKANALSTVVVDAHGTVAESLVRQALATKDSNPRAAEKYKAEQVYAARQHALALAMLYDATGCGSLEEASVALVDIRVACQATYDAHEAWRKALFLASISVLGPLSTSLRDVAGNALELEQDYKLTLEAALSLFPEDSELARLLL